MFLPGRFTGRRKGLRTFADEACSYADAGMKRVVAPFIAESEIFGVSFLANTYTLFFETARQHDGSSNVAKELSG
jgi:hypothetical protein